MESRYQQFHDVRANNLTSFNAKAAPESRLPLIFLVHDEFADWMLDDAYKKAVSAAVQRLGVKARAAGIHLIFAAQRPDKDVMPMQLRDNLGNRLILKAASEATSKITLDRGGAELLLGKGHMAAKLTGATQKLLLIPLSKLRPSSRNVRKSVGTSIPELAASIARVGLLQNLNVVLAADSEHYEVVAGRRRIAALKLLVKRRKLAKDFEVNRAARGVASDR